MSIATCPNCQNEIQTTDPSPAATGDCPRCGQSAKPAQAPVKVCTACGIDVSRTKRVKDPKGRYYCHPCWIELTTPMNDDSPTPAGQAVLACDVCSELFSPAAEETTCPRCAARGLSAKQADPAHDAGKVSAPVAAPAATAAPTKPAAPSLGGKNKVDWSSAIAAYDAQHGAPAGSSGKSSADRGRKSVSMGRSSISTVDMSGNHPGKTAEPDRERPLWMQPHKWPRWTLYAAAAVLVLIAGGMMFLSSSSETWNGDAQRQLVTIKEQADQLAAEGKIREAFDKYSQVLVATAGRSMSGSLRNAVEEAKTARHNLLPQLPKKEAGGRTQS